MNKLAKKYKQMRKSGEYAGGLSSDNQPRFSGSNLIKATRASGAADRFGQNEKIKNSSQLDAVKAHRRVKSGVSDKAQQALKNPMMFVQHQISKQTNEQPSSGQRSIKSIKNHNQMKPK